MTWNPIYRQILSVLSNHSNHMSHFDCFDMGNSCSLTSFSMHPHPLSCHPLLVMVPRSPKTCIVGSSTHTSTHQTFPSKRCQNNLTASSNFPSPQVHMSTYLDTSSVKTCNKFEHVISFTIIFDRSEYRLG